jgi:hypothetical protein
MNAEARQKIVSLYFAEEAHGKLNERKAIALRLSEFRKLCSHSPVLQLSGKGKKGRCRKLRHLKKSHCTYLNDDGAVLFLDDWCWFLVRGESNGDAAQAVDRNERTD